MTLHLARAVQAANPPAPSVDLNTGASSCESASDCSPETNLSDHEESAQMWQNWRKSRRAVVHTVEISPTYSKHAEKKVVAGFCRGLYSPHIDFHVANVNDWIDGQLEKRKQEPFLSYVFLDMPSCHRYLQKVVSGMKENAMIAIFVPSITQLADCIREIKVNALTLRMEKALELGDGISNGRLWDIRLAIKRAKDPIDQPSATDLQESDSNESVEHEEDTTGETASTNSTHREEASSMLPPTKDVPPEGPVMVCRPKVGERVIGGGFVGLWRRTAL